MNFDLITPQCACVIVFVDSNNTHILSLSCPVASASVALSVYELI